MSTELRRTFANERYRTVRIEGGGERDVRKPWWQGKQGSEYMPSFVFLAIFLSSYFRQQHDAGDVKGPKKENGDEDKGDGTSLNNFCRWTSNFTNPRSRHTKQSSLWKLKKGTTSSHCFGRVVQCPHHRNHGPTAAELWADNDDNYTANSSCYSPNSMFFQLFLLFIDGSCPVMVHQALGPGF